MSEKSLVSVVLVTLAAASGLAAQQSAMQTINSAKTGLAASQQSSTTSTNGGGVLQPQASGSSVSLAEAARQQRRVKATNSAPVYVERAPGQQQQSLGEIAAERRVTRPVHRSLNGEAPARKAKTRAKRRTRKDPFRTASNAK